jgi:hypothetical protein
MRFVRFVRFERFMMFNEFNRFNEFNEFNEFKRFSNNKQKILDIGFLMLNFGKWTNSLHLLGEGLGKGASNAKRQTIFNF